MKPGNDDWRRSTRNFSGGTGHGGVQRMKLAKERERTNERPEPSKS